MSEPSLNVCKRDRAQSLCHRIYQGFERASLRRPQRCFDFRPAQFNRVEVRRIGRQELQASAPGFNQLADRLAGVSRQVIQHHDVTPTQGREQLSPHIGFKGDAIHGTFQDPRGANSLPAQRGKQSVMRSRIARRGFDDSLPRRRATEQAGQAQICSTFIDKFQAFNQFAQGVYELCLKVLSQGFYPRRILLAVMKRLFFSGKFKRCNSRHIMLGLACTPLTSLTRSHNSTKVASGRFLTSARMKLSAVCKVRWGPWAAGKAAQLPVFRQRDHHFSNVDLWMLNCAATSAWVFPASKAAIARSRKSWEYGFIAASLPDFCRKSKWNLL
jgi:hypothetical protein